MPQPILNTLCLSERIPNVILVCAYTVWVGTHILVWVGTHIWFGANSIKSCVFTTVPVWPCRHSKGKYYSISLMSLIENVCQDAQNKHACPEVMSLSEDDAYEHTRTDQDCSKGLGSLTDQDTPTRLALAKRREAKGTHREKITSRHLASAKDLVRTARNTPSSHFSSSIASSLPCGRCTTATARSFLLSPATNLSLPPPKPSATNPRFLSIEPLSSLGDVETSCANTPRVRKSTVIRAECQLLDRACESILDYTFSGIHSPSAL